MKKILSLFVMLCVGISLYATETEIIVRAKAKDAKFIGSSVGGAYVIIRDALTDEILAKGTTSESTGNTNRIMKDTHKRGDRLSDDTTSKFLAKIDIDEPTFITIEVHAPKNYKQAKVIATTQLWLIPGKHILGEGVVLEIPGFVVSVLAPRTHQFISLKSLENKTIPVQANIVMMCGCTISDGGIWDANKIEVKGILKKDGVFLKEVALTLAEVNLFTANLKIEESGKYELIVYAYQEDTGNTGVDNINYVVTP